MAPRLYFIALIFVQAWVSAVAVDPSSNLRPHENGRQQQLNRKGKIPSVRKAADDITIHNVGETSSDNDPTRTANKNMNEEDDDLTTNHVEKTFVEQQQQPAPDTRLLQEEKQVVVAADEYEFVVEATESPSLGTIVDVANSTDELFKFVEDVVVAELVETLEGEGPFTVFAPTNAAFFEMIISEELDAAFAKDPVGTLQQVLLYHVVPGKILSSNLVYGAIMTTVNGETLEVDWNEDGALINDANIVTADIMASNGVIHIIDKVLIPPIQQEETIDRPSATIVGMANTNSDLTMLVENLIVAELETTLEGEGPFTVFAPTNAAFEQISSVFDSDLSEDPVGTLRNVLLYHVVAGEVLSDHLVDNAIMKTLTNETLKVSITEDGVMINDAKIVQADLMASNGVIHIIDKVMVPPMYYGTLEDGVDDAKEMVDEGAADAVVTIIAAQTDMPSHKPTPRPTNPPTPGPTPGATPGPTASPSSSPITTIAVTGEVAVMAEEKTESPSGSPSDQAVFAAGFNEYEFASDSPSATPTDSPTVSAMPSISQRPSVSSVPSVSPAPSDTPTRSPTPKPTNAPTSLPSSNPSNVEYEGFIVATKAPSPFPTPQPTAPPTPRPTLTPSSSPTPKPTKIISIEAVAAATPPPSPPPTPLPTPNPTPLPSPGPTPNPTPSPTTLAPTKFPTPLPSPNPTPLPTPQPTEVPLVVQAAERPVLDPTPMPITGRPTASPSIRGVAATKAPSGTNKSKSGKYKSKCQKYVNGNYGDDDEYWSFCDEYELTRSPNLGPSLPPNSSPGGFAGDRETETGGVVDIGDDEDFEETDNDLGSDSVDFNGDGTTDKEEKKCIQWMNGEYDDYFQYYKYWEEYCGEEFGLVRENAVVFDPIAGDLDGNGKVDKHEKYCQDWLDGEYDEYYEVYDHYDEYWEWCTEEYGVVRETVPASAPVAVMGDREAPTGTESTVDVGDAVVGGATGGNLDVVAGSPTEIASTGTSPPTSGAVISTMAPSEEPKFVGEEYPPLDVDSSTGTGSSVGTADETCVFCDDPKFLVDPNLSVDGVTCADWEVVALTNPSRDDCVLLRAMAVAKCGCPFADVNDGTTPTTSSESIVCEGLCGESKQYEEYKMLPNSELTCADVLTFPAVDGDETCRVIDGTYGAWCGCPGSKPPCSFCSNGLPPARPNAKFSRTGDDCGSIADTFATIPFGRCDEYREGLEEQLGYDAPSFCGCLSQDEVFLGKEPTTATNANSLANSLGVVSAAEREPGFDGCTKPCPPGTLYLSETENSQLVPDWNAPCSDWSTRLPFVTNETLCTDLQNNVLGPSCCSATDDSDQQTSGTSTTSSSSTNAAISDNNSGGERRFGVVSFSLVLMGAWLVPLYSLLF